MRIDSSDVGVPESSISIYEAIFGRRNVKEFTGEPVSDETLERMFSAAIWAPNHRLTNPTRFYTIRKDSDLRKKIAETAWQTAYDGVANPQSRSEEEVRGRQQGPRTERARHDVRVQSPPETMKRSRRRTTPHRAAQCTTWHWRHLRKACLSTGAPGGLTRLPELSRTLGADEDWTMVGVVFAGKPTEIPSTQRTSPLRGGYLARVSRLSAFDGMTTSCVGPARARIRAL